MKIRETNVAQRIVAALKRHGVDVLFGQSLPSALILAGEDDGIQQIAYRQENSGGAMADGYARVSGRIGVVTAQNGPAATLLVPPLAEALKASVPILALVQEVETPTTHRNAFQEFDHFGLFAPVTKFCRRLDDPARVDDFVDAAIVSATSGRPGPVVLLLPADVLRMPAPEPAFPRNVKLGHWPLDRSRPSEAKITEVAKLLVAAEAPVVVAGGGVLSSRASKALAELAEIASLPVFTTNMGKGAFDETHPLACGVQGGLNGDGSIGAETADMLKSADLVLLIGTKTNQNGTDSWRSYSANSTFIHCDIDPEEIGRTYEGSRLVGDARTVLEALSVAVKNCDLSKRKAKRVELESQIATAWDRFEKARKPIVTSSASPIRPERVMAALQPNLTADTIVVADASYSSMWVVGQLRNSNAGARFLTPRGLAGLGWGMPMAMGAAVARPDARVVVLAGDGGFGHNWSELETLVRHGIPLTVLILNNGVLGYQKDAETVKFGKYTTACHFSDVDHSQIAKSCGCASSRITKAEDLADAIAQAMASDSPTLLEIMSDPNAKPALSLFA